MTDFLVLPTDPELIRATWAGRTWRELHYDGDRGQRFWRVKVKGRVRTIEHGHVGKRGQASEKEFTNSEAALEAAAKGIHRQLDAGYFELSSSASDLRHALSGVGPKLREGRSASAKAAQPAPDKRQKRSGVLVETKRQSAGTKVKASRRRPAASTPKPAKKSKGSKATRSSEKAKPTQGDKPATKKAKSKQGQPATNKTKSKQGQPAPNKTKSTQSDKPAKAKSKQSRPAKKASTASAGKKTKGDKAAGKKPAARLAKLKAKAPAARPRRW